MHFKPNAIFIIFILHSAQISGDASLTATQASKTLLLLGLASDVTIESLGVRINGWNMNTSVTIGSTSETSVVIQYLTLSGDIASSKIGSGTGSFSYNISGVYFSATLSPSLTTPFEETTINVMGMVPLKSNDPIQLSGSLTTSILLSGTKGT